MMGERALMAISVTPGQLWQLGEDAESELTNQKASLPENQSAPVRVCISHQGEIRGM